jgi:hypothetical protein
MSATHKLIVTCLAALLGVAASTGPASAAAGGNSAVAKQCQKYGWQGLTTSDGTPFASSQDCVTYGAQGGTLGQPSTYPETRAFCEDLGGTFTVVADGSQVLWRCETATVFPESQLGGDSERCAADGGEYTIWTFRPDGSEDPYLIECVGGAA